MISGCADTYEVVGRQVRIEADAELEMCAGTLEHMDRFVERFAAEVGLPLTGAPWIDYRWLVAGRFWRQNPCAGSPACAIVRTVYATTIAHEHELVHAAASDLGLAHPFFLEGLAVAFEGAIRDDQADYSGAEADETARVLAVLRDGSIWLPGKHYPLAGAFTRYLIDRFGLRRYFEFYRRTWYADPYSALSRAFKNGFGLRLEQAVADFERTRARCGHEGYRFKLLECEAPELAWDGQRLARTLRVDCEDAEAVGQAGESVQIVRSLVVPADGRYQVEVRGETRATVAIGSCGGCERRKIAEFEGDTGGTLALPAGRYFVRVASSAPDPVTVGLTLEREVLASE